MRRSSTRSARASSFPGGLAAAGVIAVVAIVVVMLAQRRAPSATPPPIPSGPSAPAPYVLTDDDRATFVQAARTLSYYDDPSSVGPADRVVAYRRLSAEIEAGRFGATWPRFAQETSAAAFITGTIRRTVELTRDADQTEAYDKLRVALNDMVRAIDAADIPRAAREHARWSAAYKAYAAEFSGRQK